jgi:hypothetical protein
MSEDGDLANLWQCLYCRLDQVDNPCIMAGKFGVYSDMVYNPAISQDSPLNSMLALAPGLYQTVNRFVLA